MIVNGRKYRTFTGRTLEARYQIYFESDCLCIRNEADQNIYIIPVENINLQQLLLEYTEDMQNAKHKN